jgi:hypothetical protein
MSLSTTRTKTAYFGTAEVAKVCGVTQQAVSMWLIRGKIPQPDVRLKMGPVWTSRNRPFIEWLLERRQQNAHS